MMHTLIYKIFKHCHRIGFAAFGILLIKSAHASIILKPGIKTDSEAGNEIKGYSLSMEPMFAQRRSNFFSLFMNISSSSESDSPWTPSIEDKLSKRYYAFGLKVNLGKNWGPERFKKRNFLKSLQNPGSPYIKFGYENLKMTDSMGDFHDTGLVSGIGYEMFRESTGYFVEWLNHSHDTGGGNSFVMGFAFPFGTKQGESGSAYNEWLEEYDGEFDPLKYTYVAFKGNRVANRDSKKLAPFNLGGRSSRGLFGNYSLEYGKDNVQGLEQAVAFHITAPSGAFSADKAYFKSSGTHFTIGKRLSTRPNGVSMRVNLTLRDSTSNIRLPSQSGFMRLPTGEEVNQLSGSMDLASRNLDFEWSKGVKYTNRYSIKTSGGLRISDTAMNVDVLGSTDIPRASNLFLRNTVDHYYFRNIGIGPYVGFEAETPLSRSVHVNLFAKYIYLPSKGEASRRRQSLSSTNRLIVDQSTADKKSTGFPVTEAGLSLTMFPEKTMRFNVGYYYSHWNFYAIQGFGNENFRDITYQGPKMSLNFLF
jgi:hypothetical protein